MDMFKSSLLIHISVCLFSKSPRMLHCFYKKIKIYEEVMEFAAMLHNKAEKFCFQLQWCSAVNSVTIALRQPYSFTIKCKSQTDPPIHLFLPFT